MKFYPALLLFTLLLLINAVLYSQTSLPPLGAQWRYTLDDGRTFMPEAGRYLEITTTEDVLINDTLARQLNMSI